KNVTKSLEAAVLTRSFSQPKSTYEVAASLSEFELTKILLDKMKESKSHLRFDYKKKLYDALAESYNTDKDIFKSYGEVFSLKRSRDDKDKDQDPSAGSDRRTKRRKSSKEAESSKDSRQQVEFRPPQTWISQVARAKEPRTSFDVPMDTFFDFSAFFLNRLNIKDLTQEILAGSAFELLKGTCKSLTKLEYHLEECSKATTERLNWHNPEGKPYPFDLSKPLSLIRDHQSRQVIPQDFFINNDLEYLKGEDLSIRTNLKQHFNGQCTRSGGVSCGDPIKTLAYRNFTHLLLDGVLYTGDIGSACLLRYFTLGPKRQHFYGFAANMSSSKDVYSRKIIIAVTRLSIMKKYDYGHLEEIEVRREDQKLYKFREVDFP
nr:hypothetical protein [Tanacetum cinerariifolium]